LSLPERDIREVLYRIHNVTAESQSLYRALLSEGILHETRTLNSKISSHETDVRFAYERVWDYCVSLYFWPHAEALPDAVPNNLKDEKWRRRFAGVVRIFAMRLPEAGFGEIHDVVGLEASQETRSVNAALIDSLSWRHSECNRSHPVQ
jgi:hypothetical protein